MSCYTESRPRRDSRPLMIDDKSEGGSWRREYLARSLSTSQLREVISELEYCLAVERRRNKELGKELADSVASYLKLTGEMMALKRRISGADNPSEAASDRSPPSSPH